MRKLILSCAAAAVAATACIKVDYSLGSGLIDKGLIYDTYTVDPLCSSQRSPAASTSGRKVGSCCTFPWG